ncbi:MAG: DUF4127 family protein, partial [Candidatus Caenarcaniphilales bacterium]|nr:DUF4127 family protein [Candidatus Caenarcaniphilales bacterium]
IVESKTCPKGSFVDLETLECSDGKVINYKLTEKTKQSCLKKHSVKYCSKSSWTKQEFFSLEDEYLFSLEYLDEWLTTVRARKDIYNTPNKQDLEGKGIEINHDNFCANYHEDFPFILSPRRQTNTVVKQLYSAVPQESTSKTAFVIADRLIQCPEKYLSYLKDKKEIVIVGSFFGSGKLDKAKNSTFYEVVLNHEQELFKLKATLVLAKILNLEVKNVLYSMGDSSTSLGENLKQRLNRRFQSILKQVKYGGRPNPISWGADELIALAFASVSKPLSAYIEISNPLAKQFNDGNKKAEELLNLKLKEANLTRTNDKEKADLIFYVFTRCTDRFNDDYAPRDFVQEYLDRKFLKHIESQPEKLFSKTTIIDARIFNGSWDELSVPKRCDLLAYSGWGTFSNNVGSALAIAKILDKSQNQSLKQNMLLEAIYHDAFCNNYSKVQRGDFPNILFQHTGIHFAHFEGYEDYNATLRVFDELNSFASSRFKEHFSQTECLIDRELQAKPKLWRTFESEISTIRNNF